MSFGEGNLHERAAELEEEIARAHASHVDFPAIVGWDDMGDGEKREWLQACYELVAELEGENAELRALASDAHELLCSCLMADCPPALPLVDEIAERMAALGLMEGDERP